MSKLPSPKSACTPNLIEALLGVLVGAGKNMQLCLHLLKQCLHFGPEYAIMLAFVEAENMLFVLALGG